MTSMSKPESISFNEYKYLLRLLASVLSGKESPRPNENINWASVFSAAVDHSVAGMAYYSIKNLPDDCKPSAQVLANFLSSYRAELVLESNIQYETEKVLSELTSAGIDLLPVKGIVLKDYYPISSMRTMTDVDILYKPKDKEKVIEVFKKCGYTLNSDGFGQLDFTKEPIFHYELHSTLLSEDKKDFEYFSDIWNKAIPTDRPHIYTLSSELSYIYLLEHLAKHIEGGGAGIRMVMDIFVYSKAHSRDFDNEYITSELQKINLCKFRQRIEDLALSWFGSDTPDTESASAQFIINCPTFGFVSNAIVYDSLMQERRKGRKQSGLCRLIRRLFPSSLYINRRFPVTKKYKFLYPFFVPAYWLLRLFKDKNVNYSSVKLYLNPDDANKTDSINRMIKELGFDERI